MAMIKKQKNYRKKKFDSDDEDQGTIVAETSEDVSATIEELEELRKLRRKHAGIATEKLLKGQDIKKPKKKTENGWSLKTGGLVDSDSYRSKIDDEEGANKAAKKLKLDAFATATNTLDVDKHMMQYIESEMKKRKGIPVEEEEEVEQPKGMVDIYEELYKIPDRLKSEPKPESEGNVQLSTQMLTAIPEVDLGIDTRLKNIEETEKAKRKLMDDTEKEEYTRKQHSNDDVPANFEKQIPKQFKPRLHSKLMATDDQALARFKKRMRK